MGFRIRSLFPLFKQEPKDPIQHDGILELLIFCNLHKFCQFPGTIPPWNIVWDAESFVSLFCGTLSVDSSASRMKQLENLKKKCRDSIYALGNTISQIRYKSSHSSEFQAHAWSPLASLMPIQELLGGWGREEYLKTKIKGEFPPP